MNGDSTESDLDRLYHGSRQLFDRFDISKRGSGEGNATQGFGIYLSSDPEYAKKYSGTFVTHEGRDNFTLGWQRYSAYGGDLTKQDREGEWHEIEAPEYDKAYKAAVLLESKNGDLHFYEVILQKNDPESGDKRAIRPEELLRWDAPMSDQPEIIKKLRDAGHRGIKDDDAGRLYAPHDAYSARKMLDIGIPGLVYKGGRDKSENNYVVWNIDTIKIEKVNGENPTLKQSTLSP